jgi:hypothetical protein
MLLAVLVIAGTSRIHAASSQTAPPDSLPSGAPPVRLEFLSDSTSAPSEPSPPKRRITFDNEFEWGKEHPSVFRPWMRHNRVQGLAIYGEVGRSMDRQGWLPAYHAGLGYGFAARRGWYGLGMEQPLASGGTLSVGLDAYRSVLPFFYGDEVISEGENSASSFFLRRDYRDWYEAEGGRAYLAAVPAEDLRLSVGMTLQEERSLGVKTEWSVYRQSADFPPNPEIPGGDYRGIDVSAVYDTRPRGGGLGDDYFPRTNWGGVEHRHRITYERGDGGLGGDFDLWKVTADLRTYFRLSPRQTVSTRLLAGSGASRSLPAPAAATGDALPAQRQFVLGGLGTLRGHSYRELRGNRVALANIEYAFSIREEIRALVFMDTGSAWDRGALKDQRVPVDMGVGLSAGEEGITVLAARNVNRSDAEVKVSVRFQESF